MHTTTRNSKAILGALLLASASAFAAPATSPADTEALFAKAMSLRDAGETKEAIRLFEQLLSNQPELSRARAELAVAYFQLMDYPKAKKLIDQLMSDPKTPRSVRQTLLQFEAAIKKESDTHAVTPSVSFGYGHDSNINSGVTADSLQAGNLTLTIDPNAKALSSTYKSVGFGLSHRYLAPTRLDISGDDVVFIWQSRANYFTQMYDAGHGDFDVEVMTVSTGPALANPGKWRANLNLQQDNIRLGHNSLASYTALAPAITFMAGKSTELTVDAAVQKRDYAARQAGHTSSYNTAGLSAGYKLTPALTAAAGLKLHTESAQEDRFSNDGQETFIGLGYRITPALTFASRLGAKSSRYSGVEPIFNVARDDFETKQLVAVTYKFNTSPAQLNLTLTGHYTASQNHSNVDTYDYTRSQVGLTLNAAF